MGGMGGMVCCTVSVEPSPQSHVTLAMRLVADAPFSVTLTLQGIGEAVPVQVSVTANAAGGVGWAMGGVTGGGVGVRIGGGDVTGGEGNCIVTGNAPDAD